jgi:phosphate starvation-inducible PhoH-like protein|tara:strand:+ start:544 stop:1257 length:714 start_codon:yes stop_codon:yes gene_type:complete
MGAKRAKRRYEQQRSNIINFNTHQSKQVHILPRNKNQETYMLKLLDPRKDIVFGIGPAGTGKTLLAVQVAIKNFKDGLVDKIVITRPAVSVDEDLGFLPGTMEDKMAPWTRPIFDVFKEYYSPREVEGMIQEGIVEIAPLSYMRGRTFKKAFIVADEMQNATPSQMKMLLTRIGEKSYMVVTGDLHQADRASDNGLLEFVKKLEGYRETSCIDIVRFQHSDIERHKAVSEVLDIYGD